jgi:hypothetical protein
MEYLNPISLRQMPDNELLTLYRKIAALLAELPEGSQERTIALTNLANIRWAICQPKPSPS